jgi:isocitrate dehydrogenase
MERSRAGQDSIAVTGNVLRDYLTDLFPILELGTSAKMLSVVPLLNGGGMFETGAGGSAPRHVQQFLEEGHLRWDSLGEFCALVASFEHCAEVFENDRARLFAETLDQAIGEHLEQRRAPSRRVNELDTRGSHFYLALYWAQALAKQTDDPELQARFTEAAQKLAANEDKIVQDLIDAQGQPVEVGGYYHPNEEMSAKAMRPSATLNAIVDAI